MQNIFASIQKYIKGMQTYPEVYKNIQRYTRVYKSMQKYATYQVWRKRRCDKIKGKRYTWMSGWLLTELLWWVPVALATGYQRNQQTPVVSVSSEEGEILSERRKEKEEEKNVKINCEF